MHLVTRNIWRSEFVLAAQVERAGNSSAFYRSARDGYFHRLAPGVYLPSALWAALSVDDRFLARLHAAALTKRSQVFSHHSAAALWRLPTVNPWPSRFEVTGDRGTGGMDRAHLLGHGTGEPRRVDFIDDLCVTRLARTVVDVARTGLLSTAVAMADRALAEQPRGATSVFAVKSTADELQRELEAHPSSRGRKKCELALRLADGASGSPGESLSRVAIYILGLPAPILQHVFDDDQGRMIVDFWWPEFNLVGEFDGLGKYLRDDMTHGKTTAEVVIDEKRREDRIRALGPSVARWGWPVARSLPLLETHLRKAGLR